MRSSFWPRGTLALFLAAGVLLGPWLTTQAATMPRGRATADADVTLSVFTCCGSLAGFTDTNPSDLSSMHAAYAALWTQTFPYLRWRETAFADQTFMEKKLAAAVAAGTPPDMVFIQGGDAGYLALRRLIQPLDTYFTRDNISAGYFLPGMVRWAHFGGHWWAIPAVSGPLGGQLIYLPKYMTPLGYNNSNLRTFDDYYQMSRKAVRFDAAGNLTRIGYWPGIDSWDSVGTLMCPPGHGLYNAADQPTATDPCNVAYLRYLMKLSDLYGGYARLTAFLAGDPDFLSGNPHAYLATGKGLAVPSGLAYWNISPLDANSFGVKGGLAYQLTPLPPTPTGGQANLVNYPSTMQEVVVPWGAHHPDMAYAVGKMMFWENGDLLGRSLSGSPVMQNQQQWLSQVIAGEAALRRLAGLPGNPAATLQGVRMQPRLGRMSRASNPINPVDPYYRQQLIAETERALAGQESPEAALRLVQQRVIAQEGRLKVQYGSWNW